MISRLASIYVKNNFEQIKNHGFHKHMKRHNVFNIDNEVMYAEYLALLVYSHKNSFKKYYFTILLFLSKNCSHDEQKRLSNLINYLIQNIRHLKIFSESFYYLLKETHL